MCATCLDASLEALVRTSLVLDSQWQHPSVVVTHGDGEVHTWHEPSPQWVAWLWTRRDIFGSN